MFDIILFQPQIPPNTGNIIRLCANSGARLHLIEPLAFDLDEKSCRRAGLDYHDMAIVSRWADLDSYLEHERPSNLWAVTKFGSTRFDQASIATRDALLFGNEQHGLPDAIKQRISNKNQLYLPMQSGSRSLNLSNAVAICLYDAWRQHDFTGA